MQASHKFVYFPNVYDGTAPAAPPHLVTNTKWWNSLNFRFLDGQVTSYDGYQLTTCDKFAYTNNILSTLTNFNNDIDTLLVLPASGSKCYFLVIAPRSTQPISNVLTNIALVCWNGTNLQAYYIEYYYAAYGTSPQIAQAAAYLKYCDTTKFHYQYVIKDGTVYLVCPTSETMTVQNGFVYKTIQQGTAYTAKFVELFYDHLVIANLNNGAYPTRIAWSDIGDYTNFSPTDVNESDFYDIAQFSNYPNTTEITGLKRLQNFCFIYTSSSIWEMTYTGYGYGIMRLREVYTGTGNQYPYSLVAVENMHFFIGKEDIYTWNGVQLNAIGADIKGFFFGDLVSGSDVSTVRGYVDTFTHEIIWDYPSTALGGATAAVIYNYRQQQWYRIAYPAGYKTRVSTHVNVWGSVDSLTGTCSALAGTCENLGTPTLVSKTLYGYTTGGTTRQLALETTTVANAATVAPFLETGDVFFGDAQAVKEIDTMLVDAKSNGGVTAVISIYVSARDYLSNAVTYTKVGTTDLSETEKRVSFPRLAGRIFRFKFAFENTANAYNLQWLAFGVNIYQSPQEH